MTLPYASRISGLVVGSDVHLPFAEPMSDTAAPDVEVRRGAVPAVLEAPAASGPFWALDGSRFLLSIPSVVRCLVSDARAITYELAPGVEAADAVPFLMGTAFGVLLHQRGTLVLQASSVVVGGHAVLFCGPSGSGKSVLAAALSQRGCPVLTDDVCHIEFDATGAPFVWSESRFVRLWRRALDALALDVRKGPPLRRAIEKYYVEGDAGSADVQHPLRAVFRLYGAGGPHPAGITRQNPAAAAITLRQSAYRPRFVAEAGRRAEQFRHVTRVIAHAGVFDFRRPIAFDALPGALDGLAAHLRAQGLEARA